jgi:hypothetical protein
MNEIFVVEKGWIDPMENQVNSAIGYNPHGYFLTEEEALKFCREQGYWTNKDCWAIPYKMDKYIYSCCIPRLDQMVDHPLMIKK